MIEQEHCITETFTPTDVDTEHLLSPIVLSLEGLALCGESDTTHEISEPTPAVQEDVPVPKEHRPRGKKAREEWRKQIRQEAAQEINNPPGSRIRHEAENKAPSVVRRRRTHRGKPPKNRVSPRPWDWSKS